MLRNHDGRSSHHPAALRGRPAPGVTARRAADGAPDGTSDATVGRAEPGELRRPHLRASGVRPTPASGVPPLPASSSSDRCRHSRTCPAVVRAFDEDAKTVYVSGYAFPTELLWAFDVVPFDFEIACNNLSAASGGQGSTIMKISEQEDYSRDVCSFDRLIIACQIDGMLPKGDLYLTSSYYCHGKAKANEIVARSVGQESVLFDAPNEISPASMAYTVSQLKDIAGRLEKVTGSKLDLDRLKEAIRSSNRARSSVTELNELMKSKPCPWDGARACLLSLAAALFWGSPVMEQIYKMLVSELKERIEKGNDLAGQASGSCGFPGSRSSRPISLPS